jgi:hypothetical protein
VVSDSRLVAQSARSKSVQSEVSVESNKAPGNGIGRSWLSVWFEGHANSSGQIVRLASRKLLFRRHGDLAVRRFSRKVGVSIHSSCVAAFDLFRLQLSVVVSEPVPASGSSTLHPLLLILAKSFTLEGLAIPGQPIFRFVDLWQQKKRPSALKPEVLSGVHGERDYLQACRALRPVAG